MSTFEDHIEVLRNLNESIGMMAQLDHYNFEVIKISNERTCRLLKWLFGLQLLTFFAMCVVLSNIDILNTSLL